MHARTYATLEQLAIPNWFCNVGIQDTKNAIILSSWSEAVDHASTVEWQNICVEAANKLHVQLLQRSKEQYDEWNNIVVDLKRTTIPFVREKIETVVRVNNYPRRLKMQFSGTFCMCVSSRSTRISCLPPFMPGMRIGIRKGISLADGDSSPQPKAGR